MSRRVLPLTSRRAARAAATSLAFGAAALAGGAATAQAATTTLEATDPKGDSKGVGGTDILSVAVTYDATAGNVAATVETAAPFSSAEGVLTVVVGSKVNGACPYDFSENGPTDPPPYFQITQSGLKDFPVPTGWGYSANSELTGEVAVVEKGSTLNYSMAANAGIANLPFDCAYVATAYDSGSGTGAIADVALAYEKSAGGSPGGGGGTPPAGTTTDPSRPPVKVVTTAADADQDGIPDTADACKTVPGAKADGCPTFKKASEIRLGAKRVVVDRLVKRTAASCPPRVRIKVTTKQGRKTKSLGSKVFVVDQHGSYCRVQGIVTFKKAKKGTKAAKVTKVKVTAKGTGMGSIAANVRR